MLWHRPLYLLIELRIVTKNLKGSKNYIRYVVYQKALIVIALLPKQCLSYEVKQVLFLDTYMYTATGLNHTVDYSKIRSIVQNRLYTGQKKLHSLVNAHVKHILPRFDIVSGVDLVLDGQTMAVPAEASGDVVATHGLVASDDILDGPSKDVAVVRQPRRKRGTVIENVLGFPLGELQLRLERVDL
jgi:hypothetical protein